MATRQSKFNQHIRPQRRMFGECRDCGVRSRTYRCENCNASRRESAKMLMRKRRRAGRA